MTPVRAFRSGLWSDTNVSTSPWATGGNLYYPISTDEVYLNGKVIYLDTTVQVKGITNSSSIRTWKDLQTVSSLSGGRLVMLDNSVLTATVSSLNTQLQLNSINSSTVFVSGYANATIIGLINGNVGTVGSPNVSVVGNATLNTIGTILGGTSTNSTNFGTIYTENFASYSHTGSIVGGSGVNSVAVYGNATGLLNVTGDVYGGTGASARGISVLNIRGENILNIIGNLYANSNGAQAIFCMDALTLDNSFTITPLYDYNIVNFTGNLYDAYNGVVALYSTKYFINPKPLTSQRQYGRNGTGVGSDSTFILFTPDNLTTFSIPPVSAVRQNVKYASDALVGTCVVPSTSAVTIGIRYDDSFSRTGEVYNNVNSIFNTVISTLSTSNTIGERLKKISTVEALGHLVASFSN